MQIGVKAEKCKSFSQSQQQHQVAQLSESQGHEGVTQQQQVQSIV